MGGRGCSTFTNSLDTATEPCYHKTSTPIPIRSHDLVAKALQLVVRRRCRARASVARPAGPRRSGGTALPGGEVRAQPFGILLPSPATAVPYPLRPALPGPDP